MGGVAIISLLAGVAQLVDYAARARHAIKRTDPMLQVWNSLVETAATAAVHASAADIPVDRQEHVFELLLDLVAAGDERAWALLAGPEATEGVDFADLDPNVVGLVERFAAELTTRLTAEATRADSPLTNLVTLSSLIAIGSGVSRVESGVTRVESTLDIVAEGVETLVASRPADLSAVPSVVIDALEAAQVTDPDGVTRLKRLITDGTAARRSLEPLTESDPPGWWRSVGGKTVVAAAEHAAAYGEEAIASNLFEQAADLEGTNRPRCLARASLACRELDEGRARQLLARAQAIASDDLLVVAAGVVLDEDPSSALEALGDRLHEDDDDLLVLANVQRWALANGDRVDEAISLVRRTIDLRPTSTGTRLQLAQLLLARARGSRSSRTADLKEATAVAIEARNIRRTWHGNSAEAVLLACEAAHQSQDVETVLRLALEPPAGEALRVEADDESVATVAAVAATLSGERELAERLLPKVRSTSHRHSILGMHADMDGDRDTAVGEFVRAADAAQDDGELENALRCLAQLGEWPLPRFEEFASRLPDEADMLRGMSELNRDLVDDGIRRLGRLRKLTPLVAVLLAEAHEGDGRLDVAVEELRSGFENHGDVSLLVLACRVLMRAGELAEAEQIAADSISIAAPGSAHRRQLRHLVVELAARRGDPGRVEDLASAGIAEGDDDPGLRWHLAHALHQRNRHDEAWAELRRDPPLVPRTENEAELWLHVHARTGASDATVSDALGVVERFPDSEQVTGAALVLFYGRRGDRAVSDDEGRSVMALAESFVKRWPDSRIMWTQPVTPDDDEQLLAQITELTKPSSERRQAVHNLSELYDAGRLPLGMLAQLASVTMTEGLLGGLRPVMVSCPLDAEERRSECRAAQAALDGTAVIDLVASHVGFLDQDRWSVMVENFRRLLVPDPTVSDIDAAVASLSLDRAGFLGWDDLEERPVMTGPDPERDRERLDAARGLRGRLEPFDTRPCTNLSTFPHFDMKDSAWLAPLQIALDEDLPIYSDDLALRRLARSLDVSAFGTVAVAEALAEEGRIAEQDRDQWLLVLHDNRVVDVLADVESVTSGDRDLYAVAVSLGRPWPWAQADAVRRLLTFLKDTGDDELIAAAAHWFAVGSCRSVNADANLHNCSLIISEFHTDVASVAAAPRATALVRRACIDRGLEDPLPAATRRLRESLAAEVGDDEAAQLTVQILGGLSSRERQIVLRTVSLT